MFSTPIHSKRIARNHAAKAAGKGARSQLGMTLLEIMIVLAIIAVIMGKLVGPRVLAMFQSSKVDTTRMMVQKIANEAYTQWTMETRKSCPDSLADLAKFRNSKDTKDGWDRELVMLCGDTAPEGAVSGFAVYSKGEDGKANTKDDIKSWE